jgi:glutamate-1-semialdehyde 2,1-aminomutase
MFGPKTHALQKRAQEIVPLGVNSNFRYWGDGITPYVDRAKGHIFGMWMGRSTSITAWRSARSFWDTHMKVWIRNGDRRDPEGHSFAMTGELEIEVAEMIVEMSPAIEMVRFACSGTEATMHAIRVARAYTGRDLILKFEGNYHGFHDHTLWSTYAPAESYGNYRSPIPVPASSGIPKSMREFIITLPFNDMEGFERVMRSYGDQIAAVITEPCQGNCAAINPRDGFLELIRQKTEEHGCVFILDEVKTGFRIANGGAQEYYRIKPDLVAYAKALGNGYPIAAFGGKRRSCPSSGMAWRREGRTPTTSPALPRPMPL